MGILVFDVGTSSIRGALMNEQADILCQFQKNVGLILFFDLCDAES